MIANQSRLHQVSADVSFIHKLNGVWHERALWLYALIVILHWMEHIVQAYQIFVLKMPRPASLGLLGMAFPWLVQTETLHFGYALFMLVGLFLLRPGFHGRSRLWWTIALVCQSWHFVEHSLLQLQAILGTHFFGLAVNASLLQIWFPRVELHLFYNTIVTLPMIVAIFYHLYPPLQEVAAHNVASCSCSRRPAQVTG